MRGDHRPQTDVGRPEGEIDRRLYELGDSTRSLELLQAEAEKEIEAVRARYAEFIGPLKERIAALDKEIKTLTKKHKKMLFDGRDRVDLEHGALLYRVERKVKRARGVLENLEQCGFLEAIKVVKSVDWDVLEKWPDERLVMVGTERKRQEKFEYELKEGPTTDDR